MVSRHIKRWKSRNMCLDVRLSGGQWHPTVTALWYQWDG